MKTNEEIKEMVKQMVMAVCHGGFGRLQVMLGAKTDKVTENSFQFSFKMFRKANLSRSNSTKPRTYTTAISSSNASSPRTTLSRDCKFPTRSSSR